MNYKEKIIKNFEEKISKELEKISKIENKEERMYKLETLYKFHKVLAHYDELEPIIEQYFNERQRRNKFKGEER